MKDKEMQNHERRKEQKYVGKFLEDDYEKFQKDFLSLLKDYKRKTQRLDKIIQQSDRQQFRFLKVNEELETYKKILEDRIKTDKILFQKSRHIQMGEMVSMIAHQWRQPLCAISGTIVGMQLSKQTNKYNLDIKEERDEYFRIQDDQLSRMNKNIKHLSQTIDDFRYFFNPSKEKEKIDLINPIEKVLSIVKNDIELKGITVNVDFKVNTIVFIHLSEILHVLLNILKNSEESLLENDIEDKEISIGTFSENEKIGIYIKDNGNGIPIDILPNIFDPYFSTKEDKNGTGIGLYMSKIIIEEHNSGELLVENLNKGVCFKILWNK